MTAGADPVNVRPVVVTVLGKDMAPPEVNVAVADGVCEACDPAPVMSAVLVSEAALVTQVAQATTFAVLRVTGEVAEKAFATWLVICMFVPS